MGFRIRDSEENLFRIPDPGVKKARDPGSGSATLLLFFSADFVGATVKSGLLIEGSDPYRGSRLYCEIIE